MPSGHSCHVIAHDKCPLMASDRSWQLVLAHGKCPLIHGECSLMASDRSWQVFMTSARSWQVVEHGKCHERHLVMSDWLPWPFSLVVSNSSAVQLFSDVDECTRSGKCSSGLMICINTYGDYHCLGATMDIIAENKKLESIRNKSADSDKSGDSSFILLQE